MSTLTSKVLDSYRKELLEIYKQTIEAHLIKDVDFLVKDVSKDFMSVNNGEINYPTLNKMRDSFNEYLDNTEFTVYRDLCEPIIDFSEDRSVAWSTVQVRVEGRSKRGEEMHDIGFTSAWITLYRRENGRWIRFIEVSSFV